jgi:RNA polymerase sigma factor (sigma-70 family)
MSFHARSFGGVDVPKAASPLHSRDAKDISARGHKRHTAIELTRIDTRYGMLPRLRVEVLRERRTLVEADDETLARALISGDPRAAWVAWHRFAPVIRRTLARKLNAGPDVDDLVQQTFLCLFRRIHTLQRPQALKAFVISITLNMIRREARRRRVQDNFWRKCVTPPLSVHPDPEAREALARFCRILEGLGPADGTTFMLRFVDNRDLADIASSLGVSLSTVKRRLTRIWQRFTAQVERDPALSSYLLRSFAETSLTLEDGGITGSGRPVPRSPPATACPRA